MPRFDACYVLDKDTGDFERKQGFTVNVKNVPRITIAGNFSNGFRVLLGDVVKVRCRTMEEAVMHADRYEGIWERAS